MLVGGCADAATGIDDRNECAGGEILQLEPGDVVTGEVGERARLCLTSAAMAEYALVPFVGESRDTLLRAGLLIESDRFANDEAPFASGRSLLDGGATASGAPRSPTSSTAASTSRMTTLDQTARYHSSLRGREKLLFDRGPGTGSHPRGPLTAFAPPRRSVPVEGSTLELNVSGVCDTLQPRTGRVVAVTERAIVVADHANPPRGFTDDQLRRFGSEFDELVYPTVTDAFGEPTDLDANDRVILFYTIGVNQKTPAGRTGVVAGFFWGGDLFPVISDGSLSPCAHSNEGEIIYLAVPDPFGGGGTFVSIDLLLPITSSTAGHELQHLVNAGRRIHVNRAEALEETWLNEGLSTMAEELLFYAASGLQPRSNLDAPVLEEDPVLTEAFNRFAEGNVGRFNLHLQVARSSSPLARDGLETRGAAWSFLRYVADRDPREDRALLRGLTDSRSVGLANLETVLGADPLDWMADWGVSVLTDDLLPGAGARFQQPSWNLRALIPALRPVDQAFPIQILELTEPATFLVQLAPAGATAYPAFRLPPGPSEVVLRPDDFEGRIRYTLVRVN